MMRSWYQHLFGGSRKTNSSTVKSRKAAATKAARPSNFRPLLEQLEDRLAPATDIWTGANGANFNNPGNWAAGTVPVAGDDLVFTPGGVGGTILTNDLPGGTT